KQPAIKLLPQVDCVDGRKRRKWGIYRERLPTRAEVYRWFERLNPRENHGIAILGGAVSGGLEIIDFDTSDLYEPWAKIVRKQAPGLLDKLVLVKTPRPGV